MREKRVRGILVGEVLADPGLNSPNGSESVHLVFIDGVRADASLVPKNATVVIGKAESGVSYATEELTGVYSEYAIRVETVLVQGGGISVSRGERIIGVRTGGTIRFPSGHRTHVIVSGRGFPKLNTQYAFVLFSYPEVPAAEFFLAQAYELTADDKIHPLDYDEGRQFDFARAKEFLAALGANATKEGK